MGGEEKETAGWEEEKTGKKESGLWVCGPRKWAEGFGLAGNIGERMQAGRRRRGEQWSILG